MNSHARKQAKKGLEQYEPSVGEGNEFFSVNLSEGESAWNPEGDTYDDPGFAMYAFYGESGALCAAFDFMDDI